MSSFKFEQLLPSLPELRAKHLLFPILLITGAANQIKATRFSCINVAFQLCRNFAQFHSTAVFLLPSVSRVLLKQKGKPPPGPPPQQPRGLASLFAKKQETPKLLKAMFGGKGKEGLSKLLQLKRQETQVMTQKPEQNLLRGLGQAE